MGVFNENLWKVFEAKAESEDAGLRQKIAPIYIEEVRKICQYGIDRSKTISQTFKLYTLHDEAHIANVMYLMEALLGDHINELTRDEAAMLILSACCHDIGMSYSEKEKERILGDEERLSKYLENHPKEYNETYSSNSSEPKLTESIQQNYLRSIHHERAKELLSGIAWPDVLRRNLRRDDLIAVCRSHGENISSLNALNPTRTIDLRLCAILLRLADILDFDASRAPQAIFEYSGFVNKTDAASKYSEVEWKKHLSSDGFDFQHISDRNYPYELDYSATCGSMQIEQDIRRYLDWVDSELTGCREQLALLTDKHRGLVLPRKINRNIEHEGYISGEYRLSLDQGQVMELLVGRDLYDDPAVFVRELLQNAIDAVRTRQKLDRNLPRDWKPQVNVSSWTDSEGYHWFRVEDNGIGMTEEIIQNYFLKVGRSYYNSDEFQKAKLKSGAIDYTPISRFGIGILSCFMGDKETNLVEISTKHFQEDGQTYPALRMKMNGLSGYYYLASDREYHNPGEMRGRTDKEQEEYLSHPGTAIAVRTNLYQTAKYRGFKEIVDRYVVYPEVPVHYEGDEGTYDYPTEEEFINAIYNIHPSDDLDKFGLLEFPLSDEQIKEIQVVYPEIVFTERPTIKLKCVPLNAYTKSPNLSGAVLFADAFGAANEFYLPIGHEEIKTKVIIEKCGYWGSETLRIKENSFLGRNILGIKVSLKFSDDSKKKTRKESNIIKEWKFPLCNLDDFEWFKKYFAPLNINYLDRTGVAAHNGIYCGNAAFFCWDDIKDKFTWDLEKAITAIILLKDKYRPALDISRDNIRNLSIEAACDLLIIRKQLSTQVFPFTGTVRALAIMYSFIPNGEYLKLLKNRTDFVEQLRFSTSEGTLSAAALDEENKKGQCIEFTGWPMLNRIKVILREYRENDLYDMLCVAYLRSKYLLRVDMSDPYSKVYIEKNQKATKIKQLKCSRQPFSWKHRMGTLI